MMLATKKRYDDFAYYRAKPEARFDGHVAEWPWLDKLGQSWLMRFTWILGYTAFYVAFAPSAWWYGLIAVHSVMGPIHGAIVNWAGHKYGYRNFSTDDVSRNTIPFEFVTLGELFQNNHHEFPMSPNFGARWFELDPTYCVILVLEKLGIIRDLSPQRARYPRPAHAQNPKSASDVSATVGQFARSAAATNETVREELPAE
jgi:stearoyl-CoA desaturase (delta-9 desaturase)